MSKLFSFGCIQNENLFSFAVQQQHIGRNPAAAVKVKTPPPSVAGKTLTRQEVELLIASGATQRDRVFLLVLYGLALRIGEACNLKWSDFVRQDGGKVQVMIDDFISHLVRVLKTTTPSPARDGFARSTNVSHASFSAQPNSTAPDPTKGNGWNQSGINPRVAPAYNR
jgi:integrase